MISLFRLSSRRKVNEMKWKHFQHISRTIIIVGSPPSKKKETKGKIFVGSFFSLFYHSVPKKKRKKCHYKSLYYVVGGWPLLCKKLFIFIIFFLEKGKREREFIDRKFFIYILNLLYCNDPALHLRLYSLRLFFSLFSCNISVYTLENPISETKLFFFSFSLFFYD